MKVIIGIFFLKKDGNPKKYPHATAATKEIAKELAEKIRRNRPDQEFVFLPYEKKGY